AVQAATVAADTVAGVIVGMRVSSASTSARTALAAAGVALPTALVASALMTMARCGEPLAPKKAEALVVRFPSRPLPKSAGRHRHRRLHVGMHVRAELIERQEEQVAGRSQGHRNHGAKTRQQLTVGGGVARAADTGAHGGVRLARGGQHAIHADADTADLQI